MGRFGADDPGTAKHVLAAHVKAQRDARVDRMLAALMSVPPPIPTERKADEDER
jgi:hypothetical protein